MNKRLIHLICGARPNFVKIAPLYRELSKNKHIDIRIIHTGQHYSQLLSSSFFSVLDIPEPDHFLEVGSGTHAEQTASCMLSYEKLCMGVRPDLCVVFGDVNSTLACCLTAKKLNIPVAHVEAGLRSFDHSMPEEINRIIVDRISDMLFTPSEDANINLKKEGVAESSIHLVGNIMIDSLIYSLAKKQNTETCLQLNIVSEKYSVLTLHRPSNVDSENQLKEIFKVLNSVPDITFIFPCHPRTMQKINEIGLQDLNNIKIIDPLSYLDFISLIKSSQFVLTDSGGIQEETTYLGIPCLTLRDNTERPITLTHGTNTLVSQENLFRVINKREFMNKKAKKIPMWDGLTAHRISDVIVRFLEAL